MGAHDTYGIIPFTDEHGMLREMVRSLVDDKIGPRANRLDQEHEFPHEAVKELAG